MYLDCAEQIEKQNSLYEFIDGDLKDCENEMVWRDK